LTPAGPEIVGADEGIAAQRIRIPKREPSFEQLPGHEFLHGIGQSMGVAMIKLLAQKERTPEE
jgi:hypothetical protein